MASDPLPRNEFTLRPARDASILTKKVDLLEVQFVNMIVPVLVTQFVSSCAIPMIKFVLTKPQANGVTHWSCKSMCCKRGATCLGHEQSSTLVVVIYPGQRELAVWLTNLESFYNVCKLCPCQSKCMQKLWMRLTYILINTARSNADNDAMYSDTGVVMLSPI